MNYEKYSEMKPKSKLSLSSSNISIEEEIGETERKNVFMSHMEEMKPKSKLSMSSSNISIEEEIWRKNVFMSHMGDEKCVRLFCTLYEDHELDKNTLIQLWEARGFIWGEDKDYAGYLLFKDLLSGCYIKHTSTCYPNETKLYKVDVTRLLHGLEDMKDKELYLRLKDHHFEGSEHVQHLALVGDAIDEISLDAVKKFKDLRTLILLSVDAANINTVPDDLFGLKLLEVLDLSRTQIKELPDSIENLVDLRYLDLSFTLIELLPETIVCLSKLQTLKLNDCIRLLRLPDGTSKLTSLEHLEVDVSNQLPFMPRGIGSLEQLKSLSAFLVHVDEGRTIKELKNMNQLTGKICISGLQNVSDPQEAVEANLKEKEKLTELELRWDESEQSLRLSDGKVLELLRPTSQLKKLQILYCNGFDAPSWLSEPSFYYLTSITLFKCNFSHLSLVGLPSLNCVSLIDMVDLLDIEMPRSIWYGKATCTFRTLQKLVIVNAPKLRIRQSHDCDRDFPNLHELILERCASQLELSPLIWALDWLQHLEVINCTNLISFLDFDLPMRLVTLIIEDCPKISQWIQENNDDWRKNIEHVKYVCIDQDDHEVQ